MASWCRPQLGSHMVSENGTWLYPPAAIRASSGTPWNDQGLGLAPDWYQHVTNYKRLWSWWFCQFNLCPRESQLPPFGRFGKSWDLRIDELLLPWFIGCSMRQDLPVSKGHPCFSWLRAPHKATSKVKRQRGCCLLESCWSLQAFSSHGTNGMNLGMVLQYIACQTGYQALFASFWENRWALNSYGADSNCMGDRRSIRCGCHQSGVGASWNERARRNTFGIRRWSELAVELVFRHWTFELINQSWPKSSKDQAIHHFSRSLKFDNPAGQREGVVQLLGGH